VPRCVRPTSATDHSSTCTHYESSSFLRRRIDEVAYVVCGLSSRLSARSVCRSMARFTAPHALRIPMTAFRFGVFGRREVDQGLF